MLWWLAWESNLSRIKSVIIFLEKFILETTRFYCGGYLTPTCLRVTMSNHRTMHRRGGRLHPLHPERAVVAGSRLCSATTSTTSEQRRDDRRRVTDVTGLKVGWRFAPVNLGGTTGMFGALVPFGMRAPFCIRWILFCKGDRG